jgi:hypothetical protein
MSEERGILEKVVERLRSPRISRFLFYSGYKELGKMVNTA